MLEMGWAELLVIAIVALLAIGPEKLPEVAQGLARLIRQTQKIVREFREVINLEEFDAQIRQSSRVSTPPPGVDRDLRTERIVESDAISGVGEHPATTESPPGPEAVVPPPTVPPGAVAEPSTPRPEQNPSAREPRDHTP